MGKLTGRSAISSNIDGNLLIHVVDTTGTDTSFKATLSQLYGIFPKNSSAGAGDVDKVPKWTAANELGASIIEDDGSTATIGGTIKITGGSPSAGKFLQCDGAGLGSWADVTAGVDGTGSANYVATWVDADTIGYGIIQDNGSKATIGGVLSLEGSSEGKLNLVNTVAQDTSGSNYMNWYESDGTSRRGYVGFTATSTFKINVQESPGTSQIVLDADEIILNSSDETQSGTIKSGEWQGTAIADAYIAEDYLTATSGASQRLAVFDGTDSVEGDANLTYTGSTLIIANSSNANTSNIASTYLQSKVETDDANCLLYGYGTSNSGELVLASARGTIASPTASQSGDTLGEIGIFGAVPGFRQGARILFQATENYVDTSNYGTKFVLQTVADGSATLVTRYSTDGDGNHSFNGNVKVDGQAYSAIASTVTPSALAATIDWDNGNMQVLDLQTGGNVNTLTINNPKAGASYFIKIIQSGGGTITWPAAVKWAENDTYAGSGGAGDIDAVALTYDGTSYLANYSLDYQ